MPRVRHNDPLGVSDDPPVATDPVRVGVLIEEFKRRLAFLERSFITLGRTLGDPLEFNRSLARLKRAVNSKRPLKSMRQRLHPELELVVSELAKRHVKSRGSNHAQVVERDVEHAAKEALEKLKPRRGPPADRLLRYHVEGMMALLQEATGKAVRGDRYKNSLYEPRLVGPSGELLTSFFQRLDPSITVTRLVDIVEEARRKYAGKLMRFTDFFPGYGGSIDPDSGMPVAGPGYRIERFEPNLPIYSR